jgi:hypothetical protein
MNKEILKKNFLLNKNSILKEEKEEEMLKWDNYYDFQSFIKINLEEYKIKKKKDENIEKEQINDKNENNENVKNIQINEENEENEKNKEKEENEEIFENKFRIYFTKNFEKDDNVLLLLHGGGHSSLR